MDLRVLVWAGLSRGKERDLISFILSYTAPGEQTAGGNILFLISPDTSLARPQVSGLEGFFIMNGG